MIVALFAPYLHPDFGGVWQFSQWVLRWVGVEGALLPVVPSLLMEELVNDQQTGYSGIPFDNFNTSVKETLAYWFLESHSDGRFGGLRIPLYDRVAWRIKRRLFGGDIIEDALIKRLKREHVDLLHIPLQQVPMPGLLARFPYVINPHDFQHEHFPEFFSAEDLIYRRMAWYQTQRKASAVVVHSRQTRADAIKYLGIPEERVFYAPYGPLDTFPEPDQAGLELVQRAFRLPERFIFYPARSWVHKNHLALIDAIAQLRKRGVIVNVVFTTIVEKPGTAIRGRISHWGLEKQVRVVGRVSHAQMGAIYRLCTMVVVPSLFEQNSGPMLEAIHFGKPVAVSNIEELVNTLDGAGVVFDPRSVSGIADAIDRLWSSEVALTETAVKVRKLRERLSWEPFRNVYKQAYRYALSHPLVDQ